MTIFVIGGIALLLISIFTFVVLRSEQTAIPNHAHPNLIDTLNRLIQDIETIDHDLSVVEHRLEHLERNLTYRTQSLERKTQGLRIR